MDILPDSRAKTDRGHVIQGSVKWVPVFCANCGKEGGLVTETCTFAFWICGPCEKRCGAILAPGYARIPDQVFYEKMAQEQLEHFGRPATRNELLQIVAEDCTPLATLIKEAK